MHEALARNQSVCDHCNSVLSEDYASTSKGKDALTIYLKNKNEGSDYSYPQQHHFCDEACLASHLADRAKGTKKKTAKAMEYSNSSLQLDVTKSASYKKPNLS